jgi:hypothetical protein
MHGLRGRLFGTGLGVMIAGALSFGCSASYVGDPCIPDNVPEGGFNEADVYVETSSVQCRTRVCLVYEFEGDPTNVREDCETGAPDCATEAAVDQGIYCSCRCAVPDDVTVNLPLCECPSGFSCEEIVTVQSAGPGVRGSYCVKDPPAPVTAD